MADTEQRVEAGALPGDDGGAEGAQEPRERKPREPQVVFGDIDPEHEFADLLEGLGELNSHEEQHAILELEEYALKGEGAWALSDETFTFIGRLLHDQAQFPSGVRVALLRLLAAAALKDDIILLLHQDRRSHMLMNYAHMIDRLPMPEQDALATLVANLFETNSSSEWLLYISEWAKESGGGNISNIIVTTKVAAHTLLAEDPTLKDRGTAILHNLGTKEVKTAVFDDVATELAMAVLQFLQQCPSEEHLFRTMKALLRFCIISHQEVPMYIQMIGPPPDTFKGTSERVDILIEEINIKLRQSQRTM